MNERGCFNEEDVRDNFIYSMGCTIAEPFSNVTHLSQTFRTGVSHRATTRHGNVGAEAARARRALTPGPSLLLLRERLWLLTKPQTSTYQDERITIEPHW